MTDEEAARADVAHYKQVLNMEEVLTKIANEKRQDVNDICVLSPRSASSTSLIPAGSRIVMRPTAMSDTSQGHAATAVVQVRAVTSSQPKPVPPAIAPLHALNTSTSYYATSSKQLLSPSILKNVTKFTPAKCAVQDVASNAQSTADMTSTSFAENGCPSSPDCQIISDNLTELNKVTSTDAIVASLTAIVKSQVPPTTSTNDETLTDKKTTGKTTKKTTTKKTTEKTATGEMTKTQLQNHLLAWLRDNNNVSSYRNACLLVVSVK